MASRRARRVSSVVAGAVVMLLPGACARAQSGNDGAPSPSRAASSRARVDTSALRRTLDSLAGAHRGIVGYAVRDVDGGVQLSRRGDETFPTASLIKTSILVTVFDLVAQDRLSLDDKLTVLKIDKVPGSGQLQFLHDGAVITVRDAAWLMTTISDNTATNLLLDRIIIRRVWEKMEALGLKNTKVHSKTFLRASSVAMDSSAKYGLGVTTPNEMARLFELLALGKAVNPASDSAMIEILRRNEDSQMLVRYLEDVRVAHKTGATDAVRTDCGLFYLSSRVVVCAFTKENVDRRWVIDNEAQVTLGRIGEAVAKAWGPPPKSTQ